MQHATKVVKLEERNESSRGITNGGTVGGERERASDGERPKFGRTIGSKASDELVSHSQFHCFAAHSL